MKNKRFGQSVFVVIIFLLAIVFLIYQSSKTFESKDIKQVKISGQSIKVELALTPLQQERGLSGRSAIAPDEGMLFVFSGGARRFWMKDMNFPIDIIWIGEDLRVIYIKKDARPASPELQRGEPESYSPRFGEAGPETYGPDPSLGDAKYVLEVVSGFSEKYNLKEGDKVEFLYK